MSTNPESDLVSISSGPLDLQHIVATVTGAQYGAITTFIGTTRDNFNGRRVETLHYEAYESMAIREMTRICAEMRMKWRDLGRIAISHRTGEVPVCEASIIIAVSSPHRKESLQAVEYCIDTLKERVPIWKKEVFSDGESEWKQNKECTWST